MVQFIFVLNNSHLNWDEMTIVNTHLFSVTFIIFKHFLIKLKVFINFFAKITNIEHSFY